LPSSEASVLLMLTISCFFGCGRRCRKKDQEVRFM